MTMTLLSALLEMRDDLSGTLHDIAAGVSIIAFVATLIIYAGAYA